MGDGVGDADMMRMSMAANEWMAFAMVTVGSFLLIGSCLAYWRAVRSVLFLSPLSSHRAGLSLTPFLLQVRSGDPRGAGSGSGQRERRCVVSERAHPLYDLTPFSCLCARCL